ncbi:hypothetical protein [Novosphingobium sp. BL-8A]|uniref:hypothetical protein n=1 Tax=Novosphingobium sp. BL-8A TaxID=3127639 RepID=UPI003757BA04
MRFPVTTASKHAGAAFPQRFEMLRERVHELYSANLVEPGAALDLECAFFLNWCLEIAGRNSQPSYVDRWRAKWVFQRNLQLSIRSYGACRRKEDVRQLKEIYRSRYRDALGTMWNIYVRRDSNGRLHVPMTQRTARLFLRHTTKMPKKHTPITISGIHLVLSEMMALYVEEFLQNIRR